MLPPVRGCAHSPCTAAPCQSPLLRPRRPGLRPPGHACGHGAAAPLRSVHPPGTPGPEPAPLPGGGRTAAARRRQRPRRRRSEPRSLLPPGGHSPCCTRLRRGAWGRSMRRFGGGGRGALPPHTHTGSTRPAPSLGPTLGMCPMGPPSTPGHSCSAGPPACPNPSSCAPRFSWGGGGRSTFSGPWEWWRRGSRKGGESFHVPSADGGS